MGCENVGYGNGGMAPDRSLPGLPPDRSLPGLPQRHNCLPTAWLESRSEGGRGAARHHNPTHCNPLHRNPPQPTTPQPIVPQPPCACTWPRPHFHTCWICFAWMIEGAYAPCANSAAEMRPAMITVNTHDVNVIANSRQLAPRMMSSHLHAKQQRGEETGATRLRRPTDSLR